MTDHGGTRSSSPVRALSQDSGVPGVGGLGIGGWDTEGPSALTLWGCGDWEIGVRTVLGVRTPGLGLPPARF